MKENDMNLDNDTILLNAIQDGVRDGIKAKFTSGYNNPLDKLITDAIAKHGEKVTALIAESIESALTDGKFREVVREQIAVTLGKQLVQKFGGELEKQVNALKSDPTTRAKITLAISNIVAGK